MAVTGWSDREIDDFLRMQFTLQQTQYLRNYANASFDVILADGKRAGRLYVSRGKYDIRIVDIALLPEFRRRGIASALLRDLVKEADRKRVSLSLHVEHNNPIIPFYEGLGFRTTDTNGVYFFMRREPMAHVGGNRIIKEGDMVEKLTISNFHPHTGDRFEVRTKAGERVDLELIEVRDTSTDMMDSFHLIFRGPKDNVFPHDTHRVAHPTIGDFDLFLGPIIYGKTDGVYYQAVFNRLRPRAIALMKTSGKAVKKDVMKTAMKPSKAAAKPPKKKAGSTASGATAKGKPAKGKAGKKR